MTSLLIKIRNLVNHPTVKYYVGNPLILLKNRLIFLGLDIRKLFHWDINFRDDVTSGLAIDVVIAAIDKDYDTLVYVIESIRENIKHPINKIFVVSPKSERIIFLCEKLQCNFIDEDTVLPITKKDINYEVFGVDRSGWLFQQLLKYEAQKYCKCDHFLITEADTIFPRSRVFEKEGKIIFPCSSKLCHMPYFDSYKKLLGIEVLPLVNFTSHHTLVSKHIMQELKNAIEKNCNKPWYLAIVENIDKTDGSAVSDYETYGQYVYNNYREKITLEHWANISISRKYLTKIDLLVRKYGRRFKAVSFHSYKK